MMAEDVPDMLKLRTKIDKIEKKLNFTLQYLEDISKSNQDVLLYELMKFYKHPSNLEMYLRLLISQLKCIDPELRTAVMK